MHTSSAHTRTDPRYRSITAAAPPWVPTARRGQFALLALVGVICGLMPASGRAAIVATSHAMPDTAGAPGGAPHTVWHFALTLVQQGTPPALQAAIDPREGLHGQVLLHPGAVFGVRDFAGYIAGSCSSPAGWTCSVRAPGQDLAAIWAADVVDAKPADGVVDLVWTYVSGPKRGGSAAGVPLGLFTAVSWHGGSGLQDWSALGGPVPGGAALWASAGQVAGPRANGVPEPASAALAVLALLLAAGVTRTARQRRGPSRRRRRGPPVSAAPTA